MNDSVPIEDAAGVQARLLSLLSRVESQEALRAELARGRREFFGADLPGYVDRHDRWAVDAAAHRFTEWFLIERTSDVLGIVPLAAFGDPAGNDAPLAESRVGLFVVESGGAEAQVRDLEGGESITVNDLVHPLRAGDVLVGRMFPLADETFVPSGAIALLPESPQLAVAFQRDVRGLGLNRRLDQAELERLVFQQWSATVHARAAHEASIVPAEHLEAQLQTMLTGAGIDDVYSATSISAALRSAGEQPGAIIGPVLDELAFDTDVDLDRARELLVSLWNVQTASAANRAAAAPPSVDRPAAAEPPKPKRRFDEKLGEHLGQRLARRIEEGLAGCEGVEALFADVERLLGDSIVGDSIDDETDESSTELDDGDLEPLFREFAWETGCTVDAERLLEGFLRAQRDAPIRRTNVEELEPDDWLRWLLQTWLAAPPDRRAPQLLEAFGLAERFHDWLVEAQALDLREQLVKSRRLLIDEADRLQRAGDELARQGDGVAARPEELRLLRVMGRRSGAFELELADEGGSMWIAASDVALAALVDGDLVFAGVQPAPARGADQVALRGPIAIVPAGVESMLG